jgi:O-antigen/teichoic acid export membrane protein
MDALDAPEAGQHVARGGAFRFVAYGAGTLFSLVGIVVVARALGPGDFGRFQALLNLIVIVAAVTDVGLATLAVREYAQRERETRSRFLDTLIGLRVVLAGIGTIGLCVIVGLRGGDATLVVGAAALGIALIFTVVQSTVATPLFGHLRLGLLAGLDLGRQFFLTAAYVGLALVGAGLAAFLWASVPAAIAILVITLIVARHYYRPRLVVDIEAWRILVAGSLGFAVAIALGTFYQFAAQLLMVASASADDAGYFSIAFRIYIVLSAIPGLFVSGAFPLLARSAINDEPRFAYGLRILSEATIILSVAMALGMMIGAPFIVEVIGGASYAEAVPATRILAVALVLAAVVTTWGTALFALHAHRAIAVASLIALVPVVALTGIVATTHGATGVAILAVGAEVILAGGYGFAVLRDNGHRAPSTAPLFKTIVAAVPAFVVLLFPVPSWLQAALAVVIFGILILAMRTLPDEVIELFPPKVASRLLRRRP